MSEVWKEYRPGTCEAGGPPPICKGGHWYKEAPKSAATYASARPVQAVEPNVGDAASAIARAQAHETKSSGMMGKIS